VFGKPRDTEMNLIEKLISEPSEKTTELLFEDETEVFWVDWREEDSALAEYCESIIKSGKLSSLSKGEKLFIRYNQVSKEVPLTQSGSDRHITLITINKVLAPDYEIRMVWDSDGGDTLAFAILPRKEWGALEDEYGAERVSMAFLRLTGSLNTFTDSLHSHRPGQSVSKKWWQLWR